MWLGDATVKMPGLFANFAQVHSFLRESIRSMTCGYKIKDQKSLEQAEMQGSFWTPTHGLLYSLVEANINIKQKIKHK